MDQLTFEILKSGDQGTLWVNGPDGSCLGRFSKRFGIDVHTNATAQLGGEAECLFCIHAPCGPDQWMQFVDAMKKHHDVELPVDAITWTR